MIHLNVPSLYAGIYGMEMILDLAQRYHPELRRWVLASELDDGTRVLLDKQTEEVVIIPQYHFALFPGGTPTVVPYDIISVIAPPSPSILIPPIDTIEQKSYFIRRVEALLDDNIGAKVAVDGPNNEYVYLDYPLEYIHYPRWAGPRESAYSGGRRGKVRLSEGDTLFAYTYPREIQTKSGPTTGDIDYIPTSSVSRLTQAPAADTLDLTTPVHMRDWTKIWPAESSEPYEQSIPLDMYARHKGLELYKAEYMYKRGMIDGARVDGNTGKIRVPSRHLLSKEI